MASKKEIERYYVETLRHALSDFPRGEIEDSESPDFLIRASDRVLGVEITQIYSKDSTSSVPPQQTESEHEKIVGLSQTVAENNGLPPLMVDVYFQYKQTIAKRNRETVANHLVKIVASNVPDLGFNKSIENPSSFLKAVSIHRPTPLKRHLWQVAGGGIVNEYFPNELQQTISEKNSKLSKYLEKCGECWLVVVADWSGQSAFFEISAKMKDVEYTTSFDRVYFLEIPFKRVTKLKII